MWHCQTALDYPGNGLPYRFTHDNGMGYYGGNGNQVYLGWTDQYNSYEKTFFDQTIVDDYITIFESGDLNISCWCLLLRVNEVSTNVR